MAARRNPYRRTLAVRNEQVKNAMRKLNPIKIVWLLVLPLLLGAVIACGAAEKSSPSPGLKVKIDYYFQPGCKDCERVNRLVLPQLEEECSGQYDLLRHNTDTPEVFLQLIKRMEQLGINRNDTVSMIVADRIYLGGYREINHKLIPLVKSGSPSVLAPAVPASPHHFIFTVGTISVAGLLDGINPCVFSTLVFFLSLLAIVRVERRKILWTGLTYCLACFLTYLLLGLGLFRFLQLFDTYKWLRLTLEILMVAILAGFAALSFADAWNYRRSQRADAVKLQLPDRVKTLIHRIMRYNLTYRRLLPGAFLTGILVTLLEAVCTGQVYLPTLVLLTREAGGPSVWMAYLLLYNLMFIVPLLILFGCFFWGVSIQALLRLSKRNVIISKMLLGMFFLLLAAAILGLRYM